MADKGVRCTDERSRKGYHEPRYDQRGWHCEFCGALLRLSVWYPNPPTSPPGSSRRWVHPDDFDGAIAQRDAARRQVKKLTADLKRCQDALMRHELDRLESAHSDGCPSQENG